MTDRFYSHVPIATEQVTLDGSEAHHMLHVMRAKIGQQVTLFDGSGAEFTAEAAALHRTTIRLRIIDRHPVDRELPFLLSVGVALPKGDRQKWLVEKLTELGVASLVPLVTERGAAQPTAAVLGRLRRSVIEAAKQCGRNRLMRIEEPQAWDIWIATDGTDHRCRRLLAHPGGRTLVELPFPMLDTLLAIGPEGGFTDAETAAATAAGWQIVDLGPRILRVETAAVTISAVAIALSATSIRQADHGSAVVGLPARS
jgi:16S rRNA (uracil1498-N3)-methyltransferase